MSSSMSRVLDISHTHGMGTARVIEQFGVPRAVRKFITDHVDWLTTKVYLEEPVDLERLRVAVSTVIRANPFLRTRHIIDGERDLLYFEEYDTTYDYLTHGTSMIRIVSQNRTVILTTSHVVTDLKSCYLIGKDLELVYNGGALPPRENQFSLYDEFSKIFAPVNRAASRTPLTWRFLNVSVEKLPEVDSKEGFLLREMRTKGVHQLTFEEISNTDRLFEAHVLGGTTIATMNRSVEYVETDSDIANLRNIREMIRRSATVEHINPNTFTSRYVYNFIRTDKVFNSVLTHLLLSSAEIPSFLYNWFGLLLPMKNDTTESFKIVFLHGVFGSIVVTAAFR